MKEITKEVAAYIRERSDAHIHRTVHKYYVEESSVVKRLLKEFYEKEKQRKKRVK